MIAVVTAVNIWGARKSSDLQNVTTLMKVGIVLVLSAVLLVLGSRHGHPGRELTAATGSSLHGFDLLSGIGFAMISVLWPYEGWQFGTYTAGEVKDPQRSFPRAFLLGSLLLARLYLFAVVAYPVASGPPVPPTREPIAAVAPPPLLRPWAA